MLAIAARNATQGAHGARNDDHAVGLERSRRDRGAHVAGAVHHAGEAPHLLHAMAGLVVGRGRPPPAGAQNCVSLRCPPRWRVSCSSVRCPHLLMIKWLSISVALSASSIRTPKMAPVDPVMPM